MNDSTPGLLLLAALFVELKGVALILLVCSARIYMTLIVLPATATESLNPIVRNGLCLCLGMFVAWGQPLDQVQQMSAAELLLLLAKELLLGLLLGYAAAVLFWVAGSVGSLIDNLTGYNNVQQTNPMSSEASTPLGNLLENLAVCGFYLLGGMVVLTGILFESFRWWPLGSLAPAWSTILEDFVRVYTGRYLELVAKLATPVLVALILVDLGVGLLNTAASRLEPSSLAQPIKAMVALVMLSLLVAVFFEQAGSALALRELAQDLNQWVQQMRK
jgi:type III secretion protein T